MPSFRFRSRPLAVLLLAMVTLIPITGGAQEATPGVGLGVPDPSECTVEPRPFAFFEQFLGTPLAEPAEEPATPAADFQMPEGSPADAATVAAVTETVHHLLACLNAGDVFLRFGAFFTDDYFRREFERYGPIPEDELAFLMATPQPLAAEFRAALLAVVEVRELPDDRVAGLFDVRDPFAAGTGPSRFYWVFAEQDGRWLIDEQVMLGPIEPDQVGTPMP